MPVHAPLDMLQQPFQIPKGLLVVSLTLVQQSLDLQQLCMWNGPQQLLLMNELGACDLHACLLSPTCL